MNKSHTKFTRIVSILIIIMMLSLSYSAPLVYAAETLEFDKTSEIVESEEERANKGVLEDNNNENIEKEGVKKEDSYKSEENKSNKEVIKSKESEIKDTINDSTENKTINSNSQEGSKNTETKVKEEPSKKVLETKVGKTTVKIEYNSEVFPEGVVLKAEKIEDEERTQTIEKAIKEESAQSVSEMEALDISVLLNNEEVQPDVSKGNVKVIIGENDIDKDVKVYHFEDDENSKVKKEISKVTEDSLEFEVEHFSVVAWAKLSGYTSNDKDKDIYVTWDSDTTTIALTWDKPEDGAESASISRLKSFIEQYKNSVTTIDFSLRDENGNQVSIIMPKYSSYFFFHCNKLTNIIGEEYWDTSNVTDMGYMFNGCSNLTELDLSSFNTSNVTSMTSMSMDVVN